MTPMAPSPVTDKPSEQTVQYLASDQGLEK